MLLNVLSNWKENPGKVELALRALSDIEKSEARKIIANSDYQVVEYSLNDCRVLGENLIHQKTETITIDTIFGKFTGNGDEIIEFVNSVQDSETIEWLAYFGAPSSCLFWTNDYAQYKISNLLQTAKAADLDMIKNPPKECLSGVIVWLWTLFKDNGTAPLIKNSFINDKGHVVVDSEKPKRLIGVNGSIIKKIQQVMARPIVVL